MDTVSQMLLVDIGHTPYIDYDMIYLGNGGRGTVVASVRMPPSVLLCSDTGPRQSASLNHLLESKQGRYIYHDMDDNDDNDFFSCIIVQVLHIRH